MNVYREKDFEKKAKQISEGRLKPQGSKLDKIIYSIVAMQVNNSKAFK
jgi:hypothetical protein